jgi:hypothetical protein
MAGVDDYFHILKKFKKQVILLAREADKEILKKNFYKYCSSAKICKFGSYGINRGIEYIAKIMEESQPITVPELKKIFKDLRDYADPDVELEKIMKEREILEKEFSDIAKRKETFNKIIEQKDAIIAKQRKEFAEYKRTHPHAAAASASIAQIGSQGKRPVKRLRAT